MSENEIKIAELQKQINALKLEDAALKAMMGPEHKIAVQLHDTLCHHNHSDGCGWFYEVSDGIHNWYGSTHERYLTKARVLHNFCNTRHITADTVVELLRITRKGI